MKGSCGVRHIDIRVIDPPEDTESQREASLQGLLQPVAQLSIEGIENWSGRAELAYRLSSHMIVSFSFITSILLVSRHYVSL